MTYAKSLPNIITFYAQLNPGELGTDEQLAFEKKTGLIETYSDRMNWFTSCLEEVSDWFDRNRRDRAVVVFPPFKDAAFIDRVADWSYVNRDLFDILFSIS